MAEVISQVVSIGARSLLKELGVPTEERFTPTILAQVPTMATGLLAGISAKIEWDAYNNPFIVTPGDERVALAIAIKCGDKIFVFDRASKPEHCQNKNQLPDIIGAVGFGLSSGPFKWPPEMAMKKITSSRFSDYMAVEHTDGDGDKAVVKMPILVIELENIDGCEQHFIHIPEVSNGMTAKLQAALTEIAENK